MANYFNNEKMYTFVTGYAMGRNMQETLKALTFARKLHANQKRKSGEPYITHPLTMACHALSMGVDKDEVIAAILLHDVVEDCGISVNDLPVNDEVREAVKRLTYVKPDKYFERDGEGPHLNDVKAEYYGLISLNPIATVAKLLDRCHNVSSMAGTFTKEKLLDYIEETKLFVIPLIRTAKDNFVEYRDVVFILKYHILSVLAAIEGTIETFTGSDEK